MGISGITGLSGFQNYRISSIHGNPYSMNPIQRIGRDSGRSGKPLVIASEKPQQEDLYVKDYDGLDTPKSTATGGFADMLSIQESMLSQADAKNEDSRSYASYLNDTIGMMGFQNRLRDRLNVAGITNFA